MCRERLSDLLERDKHGIFATFANLDMVKRVLRLCIYSFVTYGGVLGQLHIGKSRSRVTQVVMSLLAKLVYTAA